MSKPSHHISGYQIVGRRLVSILERNPKSLTSAAIIAIFRARTDYICACCYPQKYKKTPGAWCARALVATVCYFPCLFELFKLLKNKASKSEGILS